MGACCVQNECNSIWYLVHLVSKQWNPIKLYIAVWFLQNEQRFLWRQRQRHNVRIRKNANELTVTLPCLLLFLAMLTDSYLPSECNYLTHCLSVEKQKRCVISHAGRGSEGCGKGDCCCQSVCLPRPCPLPPRAACPPVVVISWLSSSKEMAQQSTVCLHRLFSLHIPAAG